VQEFVTEREALDFLAGRIATEAQREYIPLSEVERKMLYFSETDWTLPDMAKVSANFDQDYDQDEYERKIGRLIANITANHHGHNEEKEEKWDAAVDKLSGGDRYLQVLLSLASSTSFGLPKGFGFVSTLDSPAIRPPHDILKLVLTALLVIVAGLVLTALKAWLFGR
jgi:hypothetical protein